MAKRAIKRKLILLMILNEDQKLRIRKVYPRPPPLLPVLPPPPLLLVVPELRAGALLLETLLELRAGVLLEYVLLLLLE